ncbi:autotransporter assembly complex family protein [Acuticoccus sp. I52.16.1]|uniref:autotransporter assembly complex protein TamA n=1 Tax=Acuticoccus sp. I52.16.1 TaxID=2928472 RepID=UPI001FD08A19|nr:autotransporter assembly complex family protein [Acuticoccus sp. I52.16.1]UOM36156.1 autotransporter assembly complex protein TamA [Acuticoccus sp. I52.16.1]
MPGSADAFEIFGMRFFEGPPEPPPEGSVSYTVEFEVLDNDGGLKSAIERASVLEEERDEPSPGAAALISRAQSDYQRILASLYEKARYGPTISILVDGREAATMPIDAELGDTAQVHVTVDPGPEFHFGRVEVTNPPPDVPDDDSLPPTLETLGLVAGGTAEANKIIAGEASLVGRWRENSYAKARIAERTASAYHDNSTLDVAIDVAPGRPAVFGPTTVSGTSRMDPAFVAYYAGLKVGEKFDPDRIDRARDQLRRLEVFKAVRIVEGDEINPDGTLDMGIEVAERPLRVFGGGVNYSTLDGAGAEAYWRHRNLFGRAEKLNLGASVSGIDAQDPTEYNYRVEATFIKPGVFTPYTDFRSTIYADQDSPDTYRARTLGGNFGLQHRPTTRITMSGYASFEASTIDQTDYGDGDFLFASLPLSIEYDGSNNEYNPTRGYKVIGSLEPFYEINNQNIGGIAQLEGRAYYGFADDRFVLAGRAAVGSIFGAPLQEIPANKLFFAGGGGSIRGYPYRGVGPRDPVTDEVHGGRSYFVGSVEARVKVTESIGVVPFFDFGNAFNSELPDFDEPLKTAAGIGLRYYTSLGPLRFDVAVPLDPYDGDPNVAFYIGLGQAF